MFSHAILLSLLAAAAHAEVIRIDVGGKDLVYTPSNVTANVNDTVSFFFHEKNHTATQSLFETPCSPKQGGFNSGFNPVPPGTSDLPTFNVTVTDTNPVWVYCQQTNPTSHCQKGMVFSINAALTGNKTFDNFKAAAIASGGGASTSSSDTMATATATAPYSANTATAVPTSSASPTVHTVIVGGTAGLVYTPPTVTAMPGDMVLYKFQMKNHSVSQSTFNSPCSKKQNGFDSGFQPVDNNTMFTPEFNITVNDTNPIWVYCRQTSHCQKGMVMAINAATTGNETFQAFQQRAMQSNSTNTSSTGSSTDSSMSSSTSSPMSSPTSGAGRAGVSAGLGISITALAVAALL